MLTLIAGESGMGKSLVALRLAASFLRAAPWPAQQPFQGPTGKVLWCEADAEQAGDNDEADVGLGGDLIACETSEYLNIFIENRRRFGLQ